jgi:hypothetical protein
LVLLFRQLAQKKIHIQSKKGKDLSSVGLLLKKYPHHISFLFSTMHLFAFIDPFDICQATKMHISSYFKISF